jgi:hypothetical protein
MSRVAKASSTILALAVAGYLVFSLVLPRVRERPQGPPPLPEAKGLSEAERRRLTHAPEAEAPQLLRDAWNSAPSARARAEVEEILSRRAGEAADALAREFEALRAAHRYVDAAEVAKRYAMAWSGTLVPGHADALLAQSRAEQDAQVARRGEEALLLLAEGRYDGAREALQTNWQLEASYREALAAKGEQLERLIRVREYESTRPPTMGTPLPPPPPAPPGAPPAPPPLPGAPHPDVKRLAEARALLIQARKAFAERRYLPAAKAVDDLNGYYGDLRFVGRRKEAIAALSNLARHGASGVAGLFHATEVKRDGTRLRLRYTFTEEAEMLDWEELQPVPHPGGGAFRQVGGGVSGSGVMSFLLKGFFENDVSIRCTARPRELRSFGLVFCQDELETRFLLWMLSNHFFVEGENYVLPRPGHAILMFGKGVNNDVPVDAPEIGFIFRGDSITKPELAAAQDATIAFAARERQMAGEVIFKGDRGGRSGSTLGDDGRGIERLRPGLVVFDNTVTFADVFIDGRIHPDFERTRVSALLSAIDALDAE